MSQLRIFALGGLDENGKNMYCIEVDDKIFIVNCGLKRPEDKQFGVECIIPDFTYVIENKDRVSGVIITHLHDDMMDALPYLLKQIDAEVYAPNLCTLLIKERLHKERMANVKIHTLPRYGEVNIKGVKVNTFGLSHAAPDAIGIAIATDKGSVVVAEQYVVDFDMNEKAYQSDIAEIAAIGKKGVFMALLESSYADKEGFTSPKHRITNAVKPVFEDAKGRIFVTLYEQNYFRLRELILLAREYKRKIYFYDAKMRNMIKLFADNGYYKVEEKYQIKQFSNDIEDCIIFVTGEGSQAFERMHRIAINEDSDIELNENDTVIIASPVVSGTEKEAGDMENELYKDNVKIVKLDQKQVLSMHPSSEDLKMFLFLLKPKYFLPVMGSYRDFVCAANLSLSVGFTPDRIIILDNGQVATFKDGKLISCSEMIENVGDIMIGTQDNKNIASFVLKDRELLSTDGVIIVGIALNYRTKEVIGGPDIQSRGVIYVKDSEYVIKNIGKITVDMIKEAVKNGTYDNMTVRNDLRERISRYVLRETGKHPMILPAIIEINMN
ncbi:MAG: ribonuclease J [Erysipelotrichia bacterium]|nr:ribonuclease J [Erysipelotrichia bacterium]